MLPTPSTSNVNTDQIYEPAEDSFLFLDTLSSIAEIRFLSERFRDQHATEFHNPSNASPLVLEVGTGSGVILAFITAHAKRMFGRTDVLTIGSDINYFACQASQQTVSQACLESENTPPCSGERGRPSTLLAALRADLTSSFRAGLIDVLICNPPYVPSSEVPILWQHGDGSAAQEIAQTDHYERDSGLLSLSYAGGREGMEVTNRLLDQLPTVLSEEKGMAYVLVCQQNKPAEIIERIRGWGPRWSVEVVGRSGKTAGWEKLQIIRVCRAPKS